MAKRGTRGRRHVPGKSTPKRASQRKSGKSLSAGVPNSYERVEQVVEHGPIARGVDARYLSLPALNIIALLGFAMVAVYQVSTFKFDIQQKLDDVTKQVASISHRMDELNMETDAKAQRRWSRLDMQMWCKDTEDTNRDPLSGKKAFTCGAIGPRSLDAGQ
jgi:hypothetical protein